MPNPFTRVKVTSQEPPERPHAIDPVPEHVKGDNNPYRGLESHGVPADNEPTPPGMWADNHEGFNYVEPPLEVDPIPVEIVTRYGREFRRHRMHRMSIDNTHGVQFIGRNESRTSIVLQNRDAANSIFISHAPIDAQNFAIAGWELAKGESVTINSQAAIFAVGSNAAVATLQAIEYYVLEQ